MCTVYTAYVYAVHSLSGLRSFVIIVVIAVKRQGARRHQECIHICFLCAYNALCVCTYNVQCMYGILDVAVLPATTVWLPWSVWLAMLWLLDASYIT